MILEACVALHCNLASPVTTIRSTLFNKLSDIANIACQDGFDWFYLLSSNSDLYYLSEIKKKQKSFLYHNNYTLSPFYTAGFEISQVSPELLFSDGDPVHILCYLASSSSHPNIGSTVTRLTMHQAINIKIIDDPKFCVAASPKNSRHTNMGLTVSSLISQMAFLTLSDTSPDFYLRAVRVIAALLDGIKLKLGRDMLSINIKYRIEYLADQPVLLKEITRKAAKLADKYGQMLEFKDQLLQTQTKQLVSAVCSLIETAPPLFNNLVLPIHWLCNNLAIRMGQELLILMVIDRYINLKQKVE